MDITVLIATERAPTASQLVKDSCRWEWFSGALIQSWTAEMEVDPTGGRGTVGRDASILRGPDCLIRLY
jgi:hypothetical protein